MVSKIKEKREKWYRFILYMYYLVDVIRKFELKIIK